jgi:hypothetical protein
MAIGIDDVQSGPQHGDGRPPGLKRTSMRGGVDPERSTRHDHASSADHVGGELVGDRSLRSRGSASPNHRDREPIIRNFSQDMQ